MYCLGDWVEELQLMSKSENCIENMDVFSHINQSVKEAFLRCKGFDACENGYG